MKAALRKVKRQRKTWGALVGRFVLAFGDIENVTYLALYQLPKDKIFDSTSTLGFGKRVELVLELINGHAEIDAKLKERFGADLKKARKLSETRNTVAHSPLMMTIYEHPGEGWTHNEVMLGNVRNRERGLALKDLRSATKDAEKLARSLYRQYSRVHKSVAQTEDA